jgi:hypothetical protein
MGSSWFPGITAIARIFIENSLLGDLLPADWRKEILHLWPHALDVGIKCRPAASCKSFSNANTIPALVSVAAK